AQGCEDDRSVRPICGKDSRNLHNRRRARSIVICAIPNHAAGFGIRRVGGLGTEMIEVRSHHDVSEFQNPGASAQKAYDILTVSRLSTAHVGLFGGQCVEWLEESGRGSS